MVDYNSKDTKNYIEKTSPNYLRSIYYTFSHIKIMFAEFNFVLTF
jgi:hypothetical protein